MLILKIKMDAKHLPNELKIKILVNLPYTDVMFITSDYFWTRYWEYNKTKSNGVFIPNQEQEYLISIIDSGKNIFINSPAGTGKSSLLQYYIKNSIGKKNVGLTSTTGISALNIGGSTLHSFLGIGLGNEDLYSKVSLNRTKRELWLNLDVLIIDEISMLSPTLFDKLEKVARKLRQNKLRFGGIQLVFSGDLFQLPCVSTNSSLIIHSKKFMECIDHYIELRNIIRQSDSVFKLVLNKIRLGKVDSQVKEVLKSRFLKAPSNQLIKPTKIFCTKKNVNDLNEKALNKLAKQGYIFREYNMTFINNTGPSHAFNTIIQNFIKNSTTPGSLQICENTQVMLTFNISPTLVNGMRGIVVGFSSDDFPIVQFIDGSQVVIKPIKFGLFYTLKTGKQEQIGYVKQVPLKIAYALTIHSCQGLTLDCASIDLRETFEYNQAYTALSRVKTLDGLYLKKFKFDVIQAHPEALKFISR